MFYLVGSLEALNEMVNAQFLAQGLACVRRSMDAHYCGADIFLIIKRTTVK